MSDVQQDGIRASQPTRYGRDVDARPSHRAAPVTAPRQKLARAGTMILLVLALALLCALIGAAIALLVHPLRDGTDLSVRSSPARSVVNLPISAVEELAAKVLPSVGALVNMNGVFVGINSASAAPGVVDDTGILQIGPVGLGFAIPADSAKRIADELIATGTASHGSLGVQVDTDPSAHGARIIGVGDGSPAAVSGLSNGALITKIDQQIVENADAFVAAVQSRAPGTRATVGIIDPSGRQGTVDIILSSDQNQR